jgi:hypothetical protein
MSSITRHTGEVETQKTKEPPSTTVPQVGAVTARTEVAVKSAEVVRAPSAEAAAAVADDAVTYVSPSWPSSRSVPCTATR